MFPGLLCCCHLWPVTFTLARAKDLGIVPDPCNESRARRPRWVNEATAMNQDVYAAPRPRERRGMDARRKRAPSSRPLDRAEAAQVSRLVVFYQGLEQVIGGLSRPIVLACTS